MAGRLGEVTSPAAVPLSLPATARLFARLKLQLLKGNLRNEAVRQVGFVVSAVLALLTGLAGLVLFGLLRLADPRLAADLGALVFTGFALGWILVPIMAFGLDETLDPARLALFPLTTRQLAVGMFTASVAGPWPLASLLALTGAGVGIARGPLGALLVVPAVLVQFAFCVVASRAVTTGLSGMLRSRRGRDLLAVLAVLVVVLFQVPMLAVNLEEVADPPALAAAAAAAVRWTPPGLAAYALGGEPLGLAALAVAAGAVLLLGWAWIALLRRAMVTPDTTTSAAAVRRSRFRPDGVLGAIVAKELKYARRDPRGRVGWFIAVMVGGLVTFSVTGRGDLAGAGGVLLAVCLVSGMVGLQAANTFGVDGPSLWMNVVAFASPADVRRDLAGRHLAFALIAVPAVAAVALVAALALGDPAWALPAMFVGWGILGVCLGVGVLLSVLLPYTYPDRLNAFTGAAPGQGGLAFAGSMAAMAVITVLALPVVLPVALGLPWAAALAVPYGAAVAWGGRRLAAVIGFGRYPEIFSAVSKPS